MSGRKLNDPVSVMCLARSGLGKSYLMERVSKCMPIEDVIEQTMFTGASLYHFEREEIKSKIFLIEDLEGAENALFPIRELQTKKRISKTMTVKDGRGKLKDGTSGSRRSGMRGRLLRQVRSCMKTMQTEHY